MRDIHVQSDKFADESTPLEQALEKSETVQAIVKQSATEMLVINTVLQQEVPAHAQAGDVAQALKQNEEIETRLQESAEELEQVNRVLESEISEREDLEQKLAEAEAKLAQVEDRPRFG